MTINHMIFDVVLESLHFVNGLDILLDKELNFLKHLCSVITNDYILLRCIRRN